MGSERPLVLLGFGLDDDLRTVLYLAGKAYWPGQHQVLAQGVFEVGEPVECSLLRTPDGAHFQVGIPVSRLGLSIWALSYREALVLYQQLPRKLVPPAVAFPDDLGPAPAAETAP